MSRERDARLAIQSALVATGDFDPEAVFLWGLPEDYGSGSDKFAACMISPKSTRQSDEFDDTPSGGIVMTCQVVITFLFRHEDPQLRDEGVERLLNSAENALNGAKLVDGYTLPAFTRFKSWAWQKPEDPERRITANFEFLYLQEGWQDFDVTD